MMNPTSSSLANFPVFILVGFPFSHVTDAATEVRLVSQSGAEVPSYVLDEISSNGFVTSAWMLAFVSVPKSFSMTFELYYGNPAAAAPGYRVSATTAGTHAGDISVDVSSVQPASASLAVTFAKTYSEQILTKVSYVQGSPHDYGVGTISSSSMGVLSAPAVVANVSSSVVALSTVYSAGDVRYTQAAVLYNNSMINARLVTNTGTRGITSVSETDLVDLSSLAALGPMSTSYSPAGALLTTQIAGAYFGYASSLNASTFEVGQLPQLVSDTRGGHLTDSIQGAGTAASISWSLGSISAGGSSQLVAVWGVSRTLAGISSSIVGYIRQPGLVLGQEETSQSSSPRVTSSWNVDVPIANASIAAAGYTVPVPLRGAVPIASRISLAGTVSYVIPSGYTSLSTEAGWTPQSTAEGDANAYATTGFYSIQEQSYTGSLRVTGGQGGGAGSAQLVSPVLTFPTSVSKSLIMRYKASFSGSGDFGGQWLYVAVDASTSRAGPFSQTLVVPAGGSLDSVARSGCESLLLKDVPISTQNATVAQSTALVADGAWRSLNVSLNHFLGASIVQGRIRFCASTAPGYAGQVELDVSSAGVQVNGPATSYLSASLAGDSGVALSFIRSEAFEPASLTLTGVLTFPAEGSAPLKWDGGTTYSATIQGSILGTQGSSASQNKNKDGTAASPPKPISFQFIGASVSSPSSQVPPQLFVNASAVKGNPIGKDVFLNSSEIIGVGTTAFRTAKVSLNFAGHALNLKVNDADGNPIPGAQVTMQTADSGQTKEPTTDRLGSLSLQLLPTTYAILIGFQGASIGTASVNMTSDRSILVTGNVHRIPLQVKNALGAPFASANISIKGGATALTLTSDGSGRASFPGVPGNVYNATVSIAGAVYYTGTILGSSNAATFELSTTYLPFWIQITIVVGIIVSMLVASMVVYAARRRPRAG